jgi:hypothetical protein
MGIHMQSQAQHVVRDERNCGSSILDVSHERPQIHSIDALQRIIAKTGGAPLRVAQDFVRMAFGPGKVSFDDFVKYRLFDREFLKGADPMEFIGLRRNLELMAEINYRRDWCGMLTNKVASSSYLAAYGLPIIPMKAIFAPGFTTSTPNLLRSRGELKEFLFQSEAYPLFGKPAESVQSLGSISLSGCDHATSQLVGTDGRRIDIETFLDQIENHYSIGYVFQERLQPHSSLLSKIGVGLATVRIVTMATASGPKVFRAAWKLPAAGNHADNFWRKGNLLAGLDMELGRICKVTKGSGFEMEDVTLHPDTGADLIGVPIPDWSEMKKVAIEGARLMGHFGMIGWDIAPTDKGPIIVEANETPDLTLVQAADRKGVLGKEFSDLVEFQKANALAYAKHGREAISRVLG